MRSKTKMLSQTQIDAIPFELRALPQWVGAISKVPISPGACSPASVTDPSTWGTFAQALAGLKEGEYTHIGFVFTENDPYTFIDLDAPKDEHKKVLPLDHPLYVEHVKRVASWVKSMGSYSERSSSGHGIHIIVKAQLKAAMKLASTELYFTQRYAIFTGDVLEPALPIAERQAEVDQVVQGLKAGAYAKPTKAAYSLTPPNPAADQPILNKLGAAPNSASIKELWEGRWQGTYPSQSEADFALLSHLAFYTSDDAQVVRLFRQSLLGQRQKANNPRSAYLEDSLQRIREQMPAPVDFEEFKRKVTSLPPTPPALQSRVTYPPPPGVLGEIADYIYGAAIHPHREIAYAGAIAFAAGIAGRHFNINGSGLNLYLLLLAGTGMGKEGASDGIDALYSAVRPSIPEVEQFRGPSNFASGGGLVRNMSEKTIPCALAVIGEFGLRLTAMCHPRANAAEITLKSALLDFFSKSGQGKVISPVAYSDSTKNTALLQAPALSVLGVSTQEMFFEKLSESSITDGLIPRFLVVECRGERKLSNKKRLPTVPAALIEKVGRVVALSLYMGRNNSFCDVGWGQAEELLDGFERKFVERMNGSNGAATMEVLNRAHLNVLRLAALAAVMDDPKHPEVTQTHAIWAMKFVEAGCNYMLGKFEGGQVGEGDHRQMSVLRDKIRDLVAPGCKLTVKDLKWQMMLSNGVVPYSLLAQKLLSHPVFSADSRKATVALNCALKALEECGEVRTLQRPQLERFEFGGRAFQIVI